MCGWDFGHCIKGVSWWLFEGEMRRNYPPQKEKTNCPMLQAFVTMEMCLSVAHLILFHNVWPCFVTMEVQGCWHLTNSEGSRTFATIYKKVLIKMQDQSAHSCLFKYLKHFKCRLQPNLSTGVCTCVYAHIRFWLIQATIYHIFFFQTIKGISPINTFNYRGDRNWWTKTCTIWCSWLEPVEKTNWDKNFHT